MLQYSLIRNEDGDEAVAVFLPGRAPLAAHESHPYFEQIVAGARVGDESIIDLFDLAQAASQKFTALSDRVSVSGGKLYIDGDEADESITRQVVRFIEAGLDDWMPLVAFIENVLSNPNEHSREMLYDWLGAQGDFTIDPDGYIVGYKGVRPTDNPGVFTSISSGKAIVNGTVESGRIPQTVGDVVEMPRSEVQHDPSVGCHTGLHVGTFDYANGFAQGALLLVRVNPRDVVSVPTDCGAAKMRTCRYEVVGVVPQYVSAPMTAALYDGAEDNDWWGGDDLDLDF